MKQYKKIYNTNEIQENDVILFIDKTGSTSASILMDQWLKAWHNENLKQ